MLAALTLVAALLCELGSLAFVLESPYPNANIPHGPSSVFVQLFEWSWADVALECEQFLGPKGFTAVQVSPVNDHIKGSAWWSRYQPVTFTLVSRSGDAVEFENMVRRCRRAGVGIYVDVVFNHVASGAGTSIAGNPYGNRSTPHFKPEEFHHSAEHLLRNCHITDYNDHENVQTCDLLGLPDLDTSLDSVQNKTATFLSHLVELGVAGFRVDAAKHVNAGEVFDIQNRTATGKSIFWYNEVFAREGEAVTIQEYEANGALEYFQYARDLGPNIVQPNKIQYLHTFGEDWGFWDSDGAVVFIDNHDTQRAEALLTYRSGMLYEFANIFMLAHPYGYPRVMSSYYFETHDQGPPGMRVYDGDRTLHCGGGPRSDKPGPDQPWVCEHRWTSIANMVAWRRAAGREAINAWWAADPNRIFFCRGRAACIAMNRHEKETWHCRLKLSLPPGRYCNIIESDDPSACPSIFVGEDGTAKVQVPPLGAVALHAGKMTSNPFFA